jgi:hypothetical protein
MGKLPQDIQNRVQELRINAGGEATRMSAIKMNEAGSVFAATGSWKPGRLNVLSRSVNMENSLRSRTESPKQSLSIRHSGYILFLEGI